jgi:hypothetical protein
MGHAQDYILALRGGHLFGLALLVHHLIVVGLTV